MTLTKKQRIALKFLAKVGPLWSAPPPTRRVLNPLEERGLIEWRGGCRMITPKGREALKEAQK